MESICKISLYNNNSVFHQAEPSIDDQNGNLSGVDDPSEFSSLSAETGKKGSQNEFANVAVPFEEGAPKQVLVKVEDIIKAAKDSETPYEVEIILVVETKPEK